MVLYKAHLVADLGLGPLIPLGLSYYSFRHIHYAFEVYKQTLLKHSFSDYLEYMFFLPTILVGPINRFDDFVRDKLMLRWNLTYFSLGLERILYGLVKVVVIGNDIISIRLENLINYSYSLDRLWLATYLDVFKFSANAYFQFSGYSDIAVGLSLLFGFRIIENFNYPFLAVNISDFWRRWHISLSRWCRNYIFYPFMAKTRSILIAVISSMVVLGLWHEISYRYLLWGIVHGIAIYVWGLYQKGKLSRFMKRLHYNRVIGNLITIHFVMVSFILVKEENLINALEIIKVLLFIK